MKFCTVFFLVISFLLLSCFAADSGNENDKNLLKEKEVKNSEKEGTENTKKTEINENRSDNIIQDDAIKEDDETKNKTNKDNWEIPIWIKGFVEGIVFLIGIAVAYRCFKSNEGHVTEAEWQEMNKEQNIDDCKIDITSNSNSKINNSNSHDYDSKV